MAPPSANAASGLDWQQHALIEFAVKAAETFVSAYYSASDAPKRGEVSLHHPTCACPHGADTDPLFLQLLPTLYLPDSTMSWNGNAFQGSDALAQLLSQMPATKHEVLGFDCHPVHGGIGSTSTSCSLPPHPTHPAPADP